jgi:fructose transport system substrate-binding protein
MEARGPPVGRKPKRGEVIELGAHGSSSRRRRRRALAGVIAMLSSATMITACGSNSGSGVKVSLILKEETNPYFVFMEKAAKQEAKKLGVDLTVTAGNADDDTNDQINEIQDALSAGNKGIIITTDGDAVDSTLDQDKKHHMLIVALDTAPIPITTADITYATDNKEAGTLVGRWAAAKLAGKPVQIALLDDEASEVLSVDVDRDHGFLTGMGIPVGNPNINGKEPTSGHYTGGKGGSYKIVCQLPTGGTTTQGQSAMETCLSKDSGINLVYAINEPAAQGAVKALQSAHKTGVTVVAIDGGCSNLPFIAKGEIAASAGQFPGRMAALGVQAVDHWAKTGQRPKASGGKDFFNTGTELYTDDPQPGVPSITTQAASKICWG